MSLNFQRTEEQEMIIENLRKVLDKEIEPEFLKHHREVGGLFPRALICKWLKTLREFGLMTAAHKEQFGGFEMDWLTHLMVFEEVAYTSLDIAVPGFINAVGAAFLDMHASDDIKEKYIPGILNGDKFISLCISEPDVGSDVAAVKTRAVKDGNHWVINGEKTWITNGEWSDVTIVTCKTGDKPGDLTHILVDREEHGFESRGIKKMALNGQSTAQLFFTDCRVPMSNTIGGEGNGLRNTLKVFEYARCHMAMWGVGVARRALAESIKYSQERIQHGKPIAGHQLIADKIAKMATEIDAARLLTYRAMSMIEKGQRADVEASMAKWYGTEIAVTAARDAVEIHGGNGVTDEFVVERLARESIISPIPDGTTEIQKLLISRALTGVQAFR